MRLLNGISGSSDIARHAKPQFRFVELRVQGFQAVEDKSPVLHDTVERIVLLDRW